MIRTNGNVTYFCNIVMTNKRFIYRTVVTHKNVKLKNSAHNVNQNVHCSLVDVIRIIIFTLDIKLLYY